MVDENGLDIFFAYTEDLLKKGILIKFYEAELDEGDSEFAVFAVGLVKGVSYSYVLYATDTFMRPLEVFRLVADAIHLIEFCSAESVFSDLEDIATGTSSSADMGTDAERRRVFEQESWEFNTALELIKSSK